MSIEVRRCLSEGDLDAVTPLCVAHAAYEELAFDPEGFASRLFPHTQGDAPPVYLWAARREGMLVGYSAANVQFSTLSASEYMHLDCLFVTDAARSRGVGAQLLAAVAKLARTLHLEHLEWQTPIWNDRARRFYERLGAVSLDKSRFSVRTTDLRV